MNRDPRNELIQITSEEAKSSHVDDLLKRQMAMRGESGVTRDRAQTWYLQNWFVFMVVGALAALGVWTITEPFFDDMHYLQGEIEQVNLSEPFSVKGMDLREVEEVKGSFTLAKQKIWLDSALKELQDGQGAGKFDVNTLKQGQKAGVYLAYEQVGEEGVALARFLVRDPPPRKDSKSALTLAQLSRRSSIAGMLLFPLMAGMIGLAIGAVDGLICRLMRRALLSGGIGLLVGFIGGFVSGIMAGLVYTPLSSFAMEQTANPSGDLSPFAFLVQMTGRGLAWALAGMSMGLGQGIALRSRRLLIYGLLGGVVGGLLGGLLFDPIDLLLLGRNRPSAELSRLVGFLIIGAGVGAMIGVVELLARDAWLRMTKGPLAGKEFLIFKDVLLIGSSPRADIYLFNDPDVLDQHATLRSVGDECEIESRQMDKKVLLNDRAVASSRLRHGDQITIGRTVFVFQKKTG